MESADREGEPLLRRVVAERVAVLAFLRSIVRRRDMAEDIFQDLCVLVIQKRQELADKEHLGSWLRTAARRLAMNALRKRANRSVLLGDDVHNLMESHWKPLDEVSGPAAGQALEECLARLNAKARKMIQDLYVGGVSYADLSRRLERSLASLYVTMSRIHKKLGECIPRKMSLQQRGGHD